MDGEWQAVFDYNATTSLPEHQMSCWSKAGFEERFALVDRLLRSEPKGSLLDVGCGPGAYCRRFHELGFAVTGVDYAPNVVALARARAPHVDFRVADGYDLPFRDGSFDVVVSIGALQCLEDFRAFIRELCRVAERTVVISTLRRPNRVDPDQDLRRLLSYDGWPARKYHPDDILPLFEKEGFVPDLITQDGDRPLSDCFFVVARRA